MNSTAEKVLSALEQYDLKKQHGNEYRSNSPLRPGSNSHGFTVTINGPEHGAYFDHVTEERGSLYELAKLLDIELPVSSPVESTKRAYEGLEEYARAHGIEPSVLQQWHWRETVYKNRRALEFATHTGTRWRFIDGEKPYYISEMNYQRSWYGLSPSVIEAVNNGDPLVLCNGEISTIAAQQADIPAIAMTGGEKSEIPDALISELKGKIKTNNLRVIVAMDCDTAGRKSGRGIESQLRREGFDVQAVDLGLTTGGDLADFCMLYGESSAKHLQECRRLSPQVETETPRRYKFASIKEVMSTPPIEWLLPGMIPARGLSVIFGESGTFKSFLALHWALRIAQVKSVLYIAAEGESGYRQRLEAWFKHFGDKYFTENLTFVLGSVNLFQDEDLFEFERLAALHNPDLIIADTLSMTIGEADTNSGRDMIQVFHSCKTLIRELGTAMLLVHHTNAEGKRATGSQRIKDSVDTMIRLSRLDDHIAVESKKSKDTKLFETFYLKEVVVPLGYTDNLGNEVSSLVLMPSERVEREEELTEQQYAVLEALDINPVQSFQELADLLEVSRGSISSVIKALAKKKCIERMPGGGSGYEVTDKGRTILNGSESTESSESSESSGSHEGENVDDMIQHDSDDSSDSTIQMGLPGVDTETPMNPYQHI